VVLVHGISTSSFIWNYQLKALIRSGYQVLRYDLFGRGLSDRPRRRYTPELFLRQLRELLEEVPERKPYALAGLSLGGAITVDFASRHPGQLAKLILIAPAGLRDSMPWWYHMAMVPGFIEILEYGFGNWYWPRFGPGNLTSDPNKQAEARLKILEQLEYDGYHYAMVSTLRHGPIYGLGPSYQAIGETNLPVHVTWSREDSVVPYELSDQLRNYIPRARFNTVKTGKHTINFDRPEWVNPSLMEFLERPTQDFNQKPDENG
jgi:pimeloyl-ACP methyl ester carboxylesterase